MKNSAGLLRAENKEVLLKCREVADFPGITQTVFSLMLEINVHDAINDLDSTALLWIF